MCLPLLEKKFESRDALIAYVQEHAPWAVGQASSLRGGRAAAEACIQSMDPVTYAATRNYGDGCVTGLSPYIRHGIVSLNEVRNQALEKCREAGQATKFIQELAWRDFWHHTLQLHPEWAWQGVEPYKTGFVPADYADALPADITHAQTGIACIDAFIQTLLATGYLHNHARMYVASYVVHFRRIKWQAGARWFLQHLLDGDVASNNLSWQWIASTFSAKPYIFNLENVDKYFGGVVDTSAQNNGVLNAPYEALHQLLFPNLAGDA